MRVDWRFFLTALGLAFLLEGIPYFLFSERMPKLLRRLSEQHPHALRVMGLTAMVIGLALILVARL